MLIVQSSERNGGCYVETKNLDGETNLKTKHAPKPLHNHYADLLSSINLSKEEAEIICELPNDQIYKFEGTYSSELCKSSLNIDNLLLRGSSLANTEWVIGVVVYAGHDTRVMMNSKNSRYKLSTIEKDTNRQVLIIF